jgi:acyl-CoA thioesterase FadM
MIQHQFVPPSGAFTRSVPVRFSHCDPAGIVERLCARIVTAMMSLEARKAVPLPQALRDAIESYRQRTTDGGPP